MEYSTNEIAMALRRGDTDVAIELVHNEIEGVIQAWAIEQAQRAQNHQQ